MGACCSTKESSKSSNCYQKHPFQSIPPSLDLQAAKIGPYFCSSKKTTKKKVQRLSKWNKMISLFRNSQTPFQDYIQDLTKSGKFLRRLKKGPPVQYRWQAWTSLFNLRKQMSPSQYFQLPSSSFLTMTEIFRDLDRTFPDQPYFNKNQYGQAGQAALQKVLGKLAGKYQEVGYCQSMNYVTGFLLMVSGGNEVQVFYVLDYLLTNFKLQGFFQQEMPLLKQNLWVFKALFQQRFPKLAFHFDKEGVTEDLWIFRWFLTFFTSVLDMPTTVRVWDYFLIERIKFLHKTALAILGYFQKKLLCLDGEKICKFLKNINFQDSDELITQAKKIKIPYHQYQKRYTAQNQQECSTSTSLKTNKKQEKVKIVQQEILDQDLPKFSQRLRKNSIIPKQIPQQYPIIISQKQSLDSLQIRDLEYTQHNLDSILSQIVRDYENPQSISGPIKKILKSLPYNQNLQNKWNKPLLKKTFSLMNQQKKSFQ